MESPLGDFAGVAARNRRAALEATTKKMDQLFKQFQSQQQHPPTAAAASSTNRGAQDVQENLVILGGFKKEEPRGLIEEACAKILMLRISEHVLLDSYEVFCLCVLSCGLFARCRDRPSAWSLVSLVRRLAMKAIVSGAVHDIWATLQKPKESKTRNRRLT